MKVFTLFQVENVRNTQDQLDKLITELQITRSKREASVIQAKVEQLRKQSEYEVLKLQVTEFFPQFMAMC